MVARSLGDRTAAEWKERQRRGESRGPRKPVCCNLQIALSSPLEECPPQLPLSASKGTPALLALAVLVQDDSIHSLEALWFKLSSESKRASGLASWEWGYKGTLSPMIWKRGWRNIGTPTSQQPPPVSRPQKGFPGHSSQALSKV